MKDDWIIKAKVIDKEARQKKHKSKLLDIELSIPNELLRPALFEVYKKMKNVIQARNETII